MNYSELYQKVKGNKTLVNGSLFTLFAFLNKGIAFLLLLILANYIMPTEYGSLNLFSTAVTLIGYLIAFCTENYLFVSYFKNSFDNFKKDFTGIFLISSINLIIIGLLIFIFGDFLSSLLNLNTKLLFISLIICYFTIYLNMMLDYMRIQEKVVKYGFISVGFASANFIFSILFVAAYNKGWIGRVQAQFVCTFIAFMIAVVFFAKHHFFVFSWDKRRIKTILFWGLPMVPHLGTMWIRQGGDRLIINNVYGLTEVGLFSFALNLVSIIIMIGGAFVNTYSVTIYGFLSDEKIVDKRKKLDKFINRINILYSIVALLIVVGTISLIPILLPQYKEALPFFIILSIYAYIQCLYFSISNILPYYHKNKDVMYITFLTSILHLGLSFLLTKYSLYYTCGVYVLVQMMVYVLIRKKVNLILKKNGIV